MNPRPWRLYVFSRLRRSVELHPLGGKISQHFPYCSGWLGYINSEQFRYFSTFKLANLFSSSAGLRVYKSDVRWSMINYMFDRNESARVAVRPVLKLWQHVEEVVFKTVVIFIDLQFFCPFGLELHCICSFPIPGSQFYVFMLIYRLYIA